MASGQRAFAQKLNKRAAADVRRQVSAASLVGLPQSVGRLQLGSQLVPLESVVEPPDFEQLLAEQDGCVERDPVRHLLEYPRDDVSVESLLRHVRTVTPVIPEQTAGSHVQDCLDGYTADYTVVNYRYQGLVSRHVDCTPISSDETDHHYEVDCDQTQLDTDDHSSLGSHEEDTASNYAGEETPRGSWASSVFDLRKSQADPLLPGLLDAPGLDPPLPPTGMRLAALHRAYPPQTAEELVESRSIAEVPTTRFGQRILIKCLQLSLELDIEPIFASLALYDCRERVKLSENFHFDVTPERLKRLLAAHVPYQDVSSLSRSCILSLSCNPADVFLVIKLEKVLQPGDISEVAEPYMRDDKNKQKAQLNVEYDCARLGEYRMPFAWTAVHLQRVLSGDAQPTVDSPDHRASSASQYEGFWKKPLLSRDDSFTRQGSLLRQRPGSEKRHMSYVDGSAPGMLGNFAPVTLTVSTFFKQEEDKLSDEELYKSLQDLQRPASGLKRLKVIPGTLKLSVSPYVEELPYCLTPELYRIHPYPDDKSRPTKEIIEFPVKELLEPYTTYRNLLYVYPKSLNFTSRQGSARNIAVKVQLMCGEEPQNALIVIFGKSSCPEFSRECFASVTYHNKSPSFYEEVKIRLPARLTDAHHLLFTFYHVACQRGKADPPAVPPHATIGYTWLPLLRDNRLATGSFGLPVSVDPLPPSYSVLHPDVQLPTMKWVDAHKPLFTVALHPVSSVHTHDMHVDRFLGAARAAEVAPAGGAGPLAQRAPPRPTEGELKRSVGGLGQADGPALIHFLPLLLNRLLSLIVHPPVIAGQVTNVAQVSFEAVAEILVRVQTITAQRNDKHGHNALLRTFIQYTCQLSHPAAAQGASPGQQPAGGYATMGKRAPATGTPIKHSSRSNSDPDLPSSPPLTPDWLNVNPIGVRAGDRSSTLRPEQLTQTRTPACKLVHEEIALQWVVSSGSCKELTLVNAWFFFELMIKSMAEHLARTGRLNSPRKTRFPAHFIDDIVALLSMLTKDIVDRYQQNFTLIHAVNMSVAFFLRDCLSWLDRGLVFRMLKHYCHSVAQRVAGGGDGVAALRGLRLDVLRVICSHEHYVSLNLQFSSLPPVSPPSPTPSVASTTSGASVGGGGGGAGGGGRPVSWRLTDEYRTRHFLSALLLSELALDAYSPQPVVSEQAISCLCNLVFSHDADPRYAPPDVRARVAALYLPLVAIAVEYLPHLYDPASEGRRRSDQSVAPPVSESGIDVANAISGDVVQSHRGSGVRLGEEATRRLLVSVLWVLKHNERSVLFSCWVDEPLTQLHAILRLLQLALTNFEYKGEKSQLQYSEHTKQKSDDMKTKLEDAILGTLSARSELMQRRQQMALPCRAAEPAGTVGGGGEATSIRLRWQKNQTHWKQSMDSPDGSGVGRGVVDRPIECRRVGGALAAELSLIVVDMLELIFQIAQQSESMQSMLGGVLRVLLHGLSLNQSTAVLDSMFIIQRSLVTKFPELLFEEEPEQCAELCLQLLRHCGSPISATRAQASGSLYLLMRQNFEIGNNFARVKMQVTMCLSWLVGHDCSEGQLRRSLKTILTYAEADCDLHDTSFPEQVRDLVFNLHMILSDTVKMKEYQQDPEMLMDLMYRIAKGYQNSPDLRLTWLQNMAGKHSMRSRHAEAAQCLVHAAGVVAEYLNMLEDKAHLPVGCVSFHEISSNVLEESAVSDDVVTPDGDSVGASGGKYFSEAGLLGLLEQAAGCLTMAGMPEVVNSIYKILIPIHEANRDFKKLSVIHGRLQEAFNCVLKQAGKRIFGTYFRVGFYGSKFGDLDNEEFIYKEPAITKLSEISHRLENFYIDQLGADTVVMVKDSNTVERTKLNQNLAYIQITYVEPYFDLYELRGRKTCFERNYNIKRFMFATPFTEDGRAHGQLSEQLKRKTVLTTSHAFPYVKTRLQVVHRQETILSPIEVAIEDVRKKTKELAAALYQDHPDRKMLQMVLQGCIGTTVNQGPVEIAMVFLAPISEGQLLTKHHSKLRVSFRDFLKKGGDALLKNKTLIGADQSEYQRELERNYASISEKLAPFVSVTTTATGKKKHRRDRGSDPTKKSKYPATITMPTTGSSCA